MNKRTIRINASALKNATCMLRFYRIAIQGYKSPINDNAIEFGSAGHLFLSTMALTNGDFAASMVAARNYFKDMPMVINYQKKYLDDLKLCSVCTEFWIHLQRTDTFKILTNDDNKPSVEVTFSNKFYEDDNFIVLLEGTIDKVGKFDNGCYALGDYKFTSLPWNRLNRKQDIESYFRSHEMGTQLRFYRFNIELKARLEPSSIMEEITKRPLGCFIDAVFTGSSEATEFKRSRIMFFPDEDMQEFVNMLQGFVSMVITILKQDTLPPRHGVLNGACAGGWRPCQFIDVCNAPGEIAREHVLKNNFIQSEYLPIKERD